MSMRSRYQTAFFIITLVLTLGIRPFLARSQDPTVRIESDATVVERAGNWTLQESTVASGGSYLYSSGSEEDGLTLEFVGTSVEVIYISGPSLGTLAIEVDGTVLRTVITTATTTAYAQSSKISYLSDEPHTLKVYAQMGGVIAIDGFMMTATSEREIQPTQDYMAKLTEIQNTPRLATLNHVIINEATFANDGIEIFNPTNAPVNMTGWVVRIYLNNAQDFIFTFPAFVLYSGAYVEIYESAGTNTSTVFYANDLVVLDMHVNIAISLQNNLGAGVDFVRWGGSTITPAAPDTWAGNPIYPLTAGRTLGRVPQNDDDNVDNDWSIQCPTLGKVNGQCLRLNEFYTGANDAVEIYNPTSEAINLSGYHFYAYYGLANANGGYSFPAGVIIPPDGYILLLKGNGTDTATSFYTGINFLWSRTDGAAHLLTGPTGTTVDFARWGITTIAPAGTSFRGNPIPPAPTDEASIARQQGRADGDSSNDFCAQRASLGRPNQSSCVVIHRISNGSGFSHVDIWNTSLAPYVLTNWVLLAYSSPNDSLDLTFIFPSRTLAAGAVLRIQEGNGTEYPERIFTREQGNYDWSELGDSGAVLLFDSVLEGVDFVRFGTSTMLGVNGANFLSPNPPPLPRYHSARMLGRNISHADFDLGNDWCIQAYEAFYHRGNGCPSSLALFLPSSQYVSLINSAANPPAPNTYHNYMANAPVAATAGGQWVMGDWDGDGDKTPGVYAINGVFYHTNDYGPNAVWTETWFGLVNGVVGNIPVAGHFIGTIANDCLGVMDSQNLPPFGIAFALYFTCNTTGGNPAKTVQWNSVLLPDSAGFSGPYQFGAGYFGSNGNPNLPETIACRRGPYITWTNTSPTTPNAEFPNAQYIGAPESTASSFVVGDWDSNRFSSFGLFYPASGIFYFRNDLLFNSGAYRGQAVGLPLGPNATATTWEGY